MDILGKYYKEEEALKICLFHFSPSYGDHRIILSSLREGFSVIEKCFKAEQTKLDDKKRKENEKADKEKAKKEVLEKEKEKEKNKSAEVREITKEEFERRKREEELKLSSVNSETQVEESKTAVTTSSAVEAEVNSKEDDQEEKDRKAKITQMDETLRAELIKHLDDKNGGRSRNYT